MRLLRALRQIDLEPASKAIVMALSELETRRSAAVESLDALNPMSMTALTASILPDTHLASQFFAPIEQARAWAKPPL